jgi:hypothetical protein
MNLSSTRFLRWIAFALALLLLEQAGPLPAVFAQASGIASPADGAVVQGQVQITGTAVHPEFLRYELFFGPCPAGAQWCGIGDAVFQPVQGGLLGVWNTTAIPDGTYDIQLRVVKKDANYESYFRRGIVVANTTQQATATPAATETPGTGTPTATPATGTPQPTLAAGTPTVIVEQPPTSTPRSSGTPGAVAGTTDSEEGDEGGRGRSRSGLPELPTGEEVAAFFDGARATACWGAQVGLGAIVIIGGYVALRNTLRAAYRRARRGGRRASMR